MGCILGVSTERISRSIAVEQAIVLAFFGRVGLLLCNILRVELVRMCEQHPGRGKKLSSAVTSMCICLSLLIFTVSYGRLSKISGKLSFDLEQSKSSSLNPKLAADVISLSQSEEISDSAPRPSVGWVQFELDLTHQLVVGIALLGVAVSVGAWDVGVAPFPAGELVPPALLVGTSGENYGLYCWKSTQHRTRATSVATTLFSLTLVMVIGTVRALGLAHDRGESRTWLQFRSKGQPLIQIMPASMHLQESARLNFVVSRCVKYCRTRWRFGPVLGGEGVLGEASSSYCHINGKQL